VLSRGELDHRRRVADEAAVNLEVSAGREWKKPKPY
jgi:hypothetical protein